MYIDISKYKQPNFRQKQINNAIFKEFVDSIDDMHTLPSDLRENMKKDFVFPSIEAVQEKSTGEVIKKVFQTQDQKFFEGVLIIHKNKRQTVCVSSQVGCPIGCEFCATGKLGFERDLTYQEIVDQVLHFSRVLRFKGLKVSNIVYMGMGEPFLNTENLEKSISILTSPDEFDISSRKITVSTIWIGKNVLEFAKKFPQVNIALSLHSAIDEKRKKLIPLGQKITLDNIKKDLTHYFKNSNRRITLEYIMLEDINDQVEDLEALVSFVKEINSKLLHVNLLPYNQVDESIKPTKQKEIVKFKKGLNRKGVNATIRKSMGEEISSACGMLKNTSLN